MNFILKGQILIYVVIIERHCSHERTDPLIKVKNNYQKVNVSL